MLLFKPLDRPLQRAGTDRCSVGDPRIDRRKPIVSPHLPVHQLETRDLTGLAQCSTPEGSSLKAPTSNPKTTPNDFSSTSSMASTESRSHSGGQIFQGKGHRAASCSTEAVSIGPRYRFGRNTEHLFPGVSQASRTATFLYCCYRVRDADQSTRRMR